MSLQKEGVVISNASYQSFHFNGESRSSVLLAHSHDKYVRSNPDAPVRPSGHGGKSRYAQWRLHAFGAGFCKLENVQTGRYLRIIANSAGQSGDKMVDVGGGGGAYTLFRVHPHVHDAFNVSLESVKFGGYFVGVNGGCSVYAFGTQNQSNSVDNCKDKYLRFESLVMTATSTAAGEAEADEKQENAGTSSEPTTLPLKTGIVVIQHALGHVRINPHNMSHVNAHGGRGQFARWKLIPLRQPAIATDPVRLVKFQNTKTGKYLRIVHNPNRGSYECDVGGSGGVFTVFRYDTKQHTLASNRFPAQFLAISCDSLEVVCATAAPPQQPLQVKRQVFYFKIVRLDIDQAETASVVCIAHKFGKHLRVSPGGERAIDGNGGCGRFARWLMEWSANECVKFKSTKSGKYLRIIESGTRKMVDVGGGGGRYTLFRWNATQQTLESTVFPGHYVAVHREQNRVMCAQQETDDIAMRFQLKTMDSSCSSSHLPYNFRMGHQPVKTVLVKSSVRGSSLRVNPNNLQKSNALGGCGQFARWQLSACNGGGGDVYKLQSCRSSRFLRIAPTGDIDVCGTGGRFTRFRVHMVGDASNAVVFESLVFAGQYLAANAATGEMYACENMHDKHCVFQVFTTADSNAQLQVVSGDNNNNVNSAHVIESQRALIDQQKMLIDQLQKTVTAQQQIIHSLQCNRANVAPSSTLQNEHSSCASTAHGSDGVIEVEQLPIPASTIPASTMTVMTDAEDELETPVPSDAEPPPVFSRPELPTFDAIHANAFNMGKIAEDSVVDGGGGGEMDEDEYEYIANPGDTVWRQGHCPDYVFRWLAADGADDKWPES